MYSGLLLLASYVSLSFANLACESSWWEMARDPRQVIASTSNCSHLASLYNLTDTQLAMCNHHTNPQTNEQELMDAVAMGARMGVQLCVNQMRGRRWNCPHRVNAAGGPIFAIPESECGTRETAFVHAVMTAALSWAITKKCSNPNLFTTTCGCSPRNIRDRYVPSGPDDKLSTKPFHWDTCNANVDFGNKFSLEFEGSTSKYAAAHNDKAATLVLSGASKYTLLCYCHGLSGSCVVRTCWKVLPSIVALGEKLREKYDDDSVRVKRIGNGFVPRKGSGTLSESSLAFLTKSPNYCLRVSGRQCNATMTEGVGSCEILCCGNGYFVKKEVRIEKNCKFVWCCDMVCTPKEVIVYVPRCK